MTHIASMEPMMPPEGQRELEDLAFDLSSGYFGLGLLIFLLWRGY